MMIIFLLGILERQKGNLIVLLRMKRILSLSVKKVKVGSYKSRDGAEQDEFIELRFIDSWKFMDNTLKDLVQNLTPTFF